MTTKDQSHPRTLIVDLSLRYGGSSARVLALLGKLPPDRFALAGLDQSAITQRARELGLQVHSVGGSKADPRIPGRLVRLIRQHNFQVIDTQNVQSKLWGSFAARRTDSALVSTINSWYAGEHGANLKGRLYQFIEFATNHSLDLYITVSATDRKRLHAAGIPEESVTLIPNAVEIDAESIHADRASMLSTFDLPQESVVCCAVGRLVWAKGYEVLIEAIAHLKQQYPYLHCLILGEGAQRAELEARIAAAGLQGRLVLTGFRPPEETLAIVKACDVFVMPSHSEGTPVALLEAAAIGQPILATHVGGIPDLVQDGEQALLIPPGDVVALSAGLSRLITDPGFAARLGANAQRRVREAFSLDAQVDATMRAYRKAWELRQERLGGT